MSSANSHYIRFLWEMKEQEIFKKMLALSLHCGYNDFRRREERQENKGV
jgi:hypothetical protein